MNKNRFKEGIYEKESANRNIAVGGHEERKSTRSLLRGLVLMVSARPLANFVFNPPGEGQTRVL